VVLLALAVSADWTSIADLWVTEIRGPRPKPFRPPPSPRTGSIAVLPEHAEYVRHVRPLLIARCVRCHGSTRQEGGLRADSAASLLKGGDSGPAIRPGDSAGSLLLRRVSTADLDRMPKEGTGLDPDEREAVARWIRSGAKAPVEEAVPIASDHWAFRPPLAAPLPASPSTGWGENPIDAFINALHRARGIQPTLPMDPGRLLRRLAINLTGLPPTPEELRNFLQDPSPHRYHEEVERYLAGPRYAERWARHWMDVWRYADEDGRLDDKGILVTHEWSSPHVWRWRDWIIRSLAEDKGLDRMIQEMLAADELSPENDEALAATGFLARNYFKHSRNVQLTAMVEHTSRAFLGLTMNCARCHDHKHDPIPQADFYRLRAFFEPLEIKTKDLGGGASLVHVVDEHPGEPTRLFRRGDERQPVLDQALKPGVPVVLESAPLLPVIPRGGIRSTGRRLALARWLVDRRNPLTARVAVNQVWARHFGRGLVPDPGDFGVRGTPPSHPELLDWLAVRFQESGWSQKWLHRLIVTSRTFQLHSSLPSGNPTSDPDNAFLWRFPSRRMEAEAIRDSLLHLAGRLDSGTGGPSTPHTRADESPRRSLYLRASRTDRPEFLASFDPPNVEECCFRRTSILPQQAMVLMNSPFVWSQAEAISDGLPFDSEDFVRTAFLAVLCRLPSAEEASDCIRFLSEQADTLAGERTPRPDAVRSARTYLVHALLNHNDFITIR
jgi:cytochrome c553